MKGIPMKTTRLIGATVLTAVCGFALHLAQAHQGGAIARIDLVHRDLGDPEREAVQARVEFGPGAAFGKHSHPGAEIAYVLEGTLEYQLDGNLPITLNAGESLFIPAGSVHSAKN